jgi:hypothetical protein
MTDWTFQKLIRCEEGQGTGTAKSVPPFPRYCLDVSVAANDETAALSSPFGQRRGHRRRHDVATAAWST